MEFLKTMNNNPPPFSGIGTLLFSDIINIAAVISLAPDDLKKVMNRHLQYVTDIIEAHSGVVYQFVGDAVAAYWRPDHTSPNHAQLAFNAGREVLHSLPALMAKQKGVSYGVDIVLGTGQMCGDTFGPIKQFQIIGIAKAIADRIYREHRVQGGSFIRMSQYTVELINDPGGLVETGIIARNMLDDLRVLSYRPANSDQ